MTGEELMRVAIEEAKKSQESLKCGVVIARNGKILAKTYNSQREDNNASAHAEIKAVGVAGKLVGSKNLDGCVAYCTCEPCIMCQTALMYAKIAKIYYGSNLDLPPKNNMKNVEITKNFLKEECDELLKTE